MSLCIQLDYKYEYISVDNFVHEDIILFEQDSYYVNLEDTFKNYSINIDEYIVTYKYNQIDEIISFKNNYIKPVTTGGVLFYAHLRKPKEKTVYIYLVYSIRSIIESSFEEIKTVEDLISVRESKSGNYILKNDIDLSGINFKPFTFDSSLEYFNGRFINLDGYTISNFTMDSEQVINVTDNEYYFISFFPIIEHSLIYGLIFDNVSINYDFKNFDISSNVGTIASFSSGSIIKNNFISGKIYGRNYTGGIIGQSYQTTFINNIFLGEITQINHGYENFVGGITGHSSLGGKFITNIFAGEIQADTDKVGTIIGESYGMPKIFINNNSYASLNGETFNNKISNLPEYN